LKDDEPSGSFEPLRFMPKTKQPQLEDPDVLKRRTEEAISFVALDRLPSARVRLCQLIEDNKVTADD
jgi:hypothetical protein